MHKNIRPTSPALLYCFFCSAHTINGSHTVCALICGCAIVLIRAVCNEWKQNYVISTIRYANPNVSADGIFFSFSFEGIKKRSSFLNSSTDINCFFAKLMSTFLRHFLILQILQKKKHISSGSFVVQFRDQFFYLAQITYPIVNEMPFKVLTLSVFFLLSVFVKQNKTEINSFRSMYVDVMW